MKEFWNSVNNRNKVNINLLSDKDVTVYDMGGLFNPRNKTLMKMFNLINIGECAGSGVPNIFNVWEDEGWVELVIEEQFDPDWTVLSLTFNKKQVIKTSDIADYIGLSHARTRAILSEMDDVETVGKNKNRRYNFVK